MSEMKEKILNTVGLSFGLIGVIFIFIWGPPQPNFSQGTPLVISNNTILESGIKISDLEKEKQEKRMFYKMMSEIGLLLILFGFSIQLLSLWLNEVISKSKAILNFLYSNKKS